MIEHISNENEQKRIRKKICESWKSFWKDEDTTGKELLCSSVLPSILPEEINKTLREHGLDLVEVQTMEPPKKL